MSTSRREEDGEVGKVGSGKVWAEIWNFGDQDRLKIILKMGFWSVEKDWVSGNNSGLKENDFLKG